MKRFLFCMIFLIFINRVSGEIVQVFSIEVRHVKVSQYAVNCQVEDERELEVTYYSVGKRLGNITIKSSLQELYQSAKMNDHSMDPFFNAATKLLLLDEKGKTYVVIFENESVENPTVRVGLGSLAKLDKAGEVQIGSPYDSTSYDEKLIDEIRKFLVSVKSK